METFLFLCLAALLLWLSIRGPIARYQAQARRTRAARRRLGFELRQYMKFRRERIRANR